LMAISSLAPSIEPSRKIIGTVGGVSCLKRAIGDPHDPYVLGGTRQDCRFGHAPHQPPSSSEVGAVQTVRAFPCARTEARKSGTENLMPTGPTCGGVAASSDFAILATTAERREAF
jgi:hypothetical protein